MLQKIKNLFLSEEEKFKNQYSGQLLVTLNALEEVQGPDKNVLDVLVDTLNILNPWFDNDGIVFLKTKKLPLHIQEHISDFNTISKTIRNMYELNRTEKGERSTGNNVYLGNRYGLPTKPINYWKTIDPLDDALLKEPIVNIIQKQARGKLINITLPTIALIKALLSSWDSAQSRINREAYG